MNTLFLLTKEYPAIAHEELTTLCGKTLHQDQNLFHINLTKQKISILRQRLALTRSIHRLLFQCKKSQLLKKIQSFNWQSVYQKNFSIKVSTIDTSQPITEKQIAKEVWKKIKNPKVKLDNAQTKIVILLTKKQAYVTLLLHKQEPDFKDRRAHLRPFAYSSSLHPRLARALINCLGIKKGEFLLDPCCGSGGFLIEAGMMGLKTKGYDLYGRLIWGAAKNLDHYNITHYHIETKDALTFNKKVNFIITDLPYGLNSNVFVKGEKKLSGKRKRMENKKALLNFYQEFLNMVKKNLKKQAILIFPDFVNYKSLIKKSKLKIKKEFSVYVHKRLTRKIVKLSV